MSETWVYGLIAVGLLVCVGLVVFIQRQRTTIKAAQEEQAAKLHALEAKAQEQRDYLIESIHVIANAMIHDERMTLTEGTIRISVLLDNLSPQLKQEPDFSVINEVFERTRHIPYLNKWKELDKQERWRYKQEMKQIEAEHKDALLKAAGLLASYPFEKHFH
ncbi:MAG: DUF2489 domain-containing protein [Oceanospirillaceae bacterium]|nr:DUF2489 domain-containing protein [Oceanospirillaceae bacterium]